MTEDISGKILIVDDNLANLHLLVDMLSRHGYEIFVARSGEEALKITRGTQVDLILLDIMMPEMNGYEVCRVFKSSPDNEKTPVIFLSALDDIESKIKGFSVGAVDYVSKPYQEDEIIARIHTHVSLEYTRRKLEDTISDLRNSETLRQESEKHLETILNSIPQLIIYLDPYMKIKYFNKMAERLLILPNMSIINRSLKEFISGEYFYRIDPFLQRAFSGEHVQKDTYLADIHGRNHLFDAQIIPDIDGNDVVKGLFLVLTDITHYKNAETTIHTLQKQMEIILNSIQSAIYVADMKTHEVIYANKECNEIYGDVVGKKSFKIFQQNQSISCPYCEDNKLVTPDGTPSGVYTWEYENTRNGRWYFCLDIVIPWIDERIVRMEIATDITEKKMNELALKRANKKLNLLSKITRHDILNMLTAIHIYCDSLSIMEIKPEIRTMIDKHREVAMNIEQMLSFTRDYQEMGNKIPIWQNAEDILHNAIGTKDLSPIRLVNYLRGLIIYADPLIEKVLYNLVENAHRHGKKVSTITFSYQDLGTSVIIICEDDGIGISKENKNKIFTREFYQNSGFGLLISNDILDINGMTISETGKEGKGARFEICIPSGKYKFE